MVPKLLQLLTRLLRKAAALLAALCVAVTASVNANADLSMTIDRIKPSIVMVGTFQETASPKFSLFGSGFAVGPNLVTTNAHVVVPLLGKSGTTQLAVRLADRDTSDQLRPAKLLSLDEAHDLALLQVAGSPLEPVEIGDSDLVREGMLVAFTGFPIGAALGFSPVTHRGIVSAITSIAPPSPDVRALDAKRIRAIKTGAFQVFQLDATAYPGNSGGPMFDPGTGRVIGVINMVFIKGVRETALTHPSGISYAIPARYLVPLVREASNSFTLSPEPH